MNNLDPTTTPRGRCDEPATAEVIEGIALFNQGKFFECHEVLEAAWLAERGPIRYLYQGILQVGVGFYHAGRGNCRGAIGLLESGLRNLATFEPACQGIDVASLVAAARSAKAEFERLGPDGIRNFDVSLIPQVRITT